MKNKFRELSADSMPGLDTGEIFEQGRREDGGSTPSSKNKNLSFWKYFTPEGKLEWKSKEVLLLFCSGLRMNVIIVCRHLGRCFQI